MVEPINLNKARKARARTEATEKAARNRVLHGLTKAQKTAARLEADRVERELAAKRREDL